MPGLANDQLGVWDLTVADHESGERVATLTVIGTTVTPDRFAMDFQGQYVESTGAQVYIYAIYLDSYHYTPEFRTYHQDPRQSEHPERDLDSTC